MPLIPESVYYLFKDENSVSLERFRANVASAPILLKINFCSFAYNKCKQKYRTQEVPMADQQNFERYLDRGSVEVLEMLKSIKSPDEAQIIRGQVCFYGFLDRIDVVLKALAGDANALEHTRAIIQSPTQSRSQSYQYIPNREMHNRVLMSSQRIMRLARLRRLEMENGVIDLTLSNDPTASEEDDEMESNEVTESMGSRILENNINMNSNNGNDVINSEQGTQSVNGFISDRYDGDLSNEIEEINESEDSVIDLDDYTEIDDNDEPMRYQRMRQQVLKSMHNHHPPPPFPAYALNSEDMIQYAPYLLVNPLRQPTSNGQTRYSAYFDTSNAFNGSTGVYMSTRLFGHSSHTLNEMVMNGRREEDAVVHEQENRVEVIEEEEVSEENEVEVIAENRVEVIEEEEVSEVVEEINGNGVVQVEGNDVSIENNNNNSNEMCVVINNGNEEVQNIVTETIADNVQNLSVNPNSNSIPLNASEVDDDDFLSSYSNASNRKRESSDEQDEEDSKKKAKCEI